MRLKNASIISIQPDRFPSPSSQSMLSHAIVVEQKSLSDGDRRHLIARFAAFDFVIARRSRFPSNFRLPLSS